MKKIVLYSHGGSGNRGCEAIVRGTRKIIGETCGENRFYLGSLNREEDVSVNISGFDDIIEYSNYVEKNSLDHIIASVNNRLFGSVEKYITLGQKKLYKLFDNNTIAISVGGDNYCYTDSKWLYISHKEAKKRNAKTVLWGCSLEEGNMDEEMVEDLKSYDLIIARESITYNSLLQKGVIKNTKLYPDPAFQLECEEINLPVGFKKGDTIGINLSPYIFKSKLPKNDVIRLYTNLIHHIIETTDMQIALIPHVFWNHNYDLEVLGEIYKQSNGGDRVLLIKQNYNCMQLKYLISNCRLFIGARTHSTIAAYSTFVPTLVLGYSVKSRGLARDIFGSEENMVISVQELDSEDALINAYEYVHKNEVDLRNHLSNFIPKYKAAAHAAGNEIKKFFIEKVKYEKQSI
jgi:colanic acid/amylovoran biosynthesis protein